ncbi:hypothetical protein PIB30_099832, partial [Stylosanthes scabra]|nr:hypothetical protein [Stylosanthes scabra]
KKREMMPRARAWKEQALLLMKNLGGKMMMDSAKKEGMKETCFDDSKMILVKRKTREED